MQFVSVNTIEWVTYMYLIGITKGLFIKLTDLWFLNVFYGSSHSPDVYTLLVRCT